MLKLAVVPEFFFEVHNYDAKMAGALSPAETPMRAALRHCA